MTPQTAAMTLGILRLRAMALCIPKETCLLLGISPRQRLAEYLARN